MRNPSKRPSTQNELRSWKLLVSVIRVWTSELFQEREGVFENILNALHNKR